jgi:Flp pilus assembly pilin Flp
MTKLTHIFATLMNDESGTAVTEWVVVASIMALAGVATFLAIGGDVASILGTIATDVGVMETGVNG